MRGRLPPSSTNNGDSGLTDRLLAAFLAPVIFNISNLIMVGLLFRRSSSGFGRFLVQDVPKLGSFLLWALLIIPALVGLIIGMDRLIKLIGHLFYTNTENERDQTVTLAAWVCLLLAAFLLSRAF
jgi:hypothetical protein